MTYRQIRKVPLPELEYRILKGDVTDFPLLPTIRTELVKVPCIDLNELKEGFFREFSKLGTRVHGGKDLLILYNEETKNLYKVVWRRGATDVTGSLPHAYFSFDFYPYSGNLEPLIEKLKELKATEVTENSD